MKKQTYDDAQPLDADTRAFLRAFADALEHTRDTLRAETREHARPRSDRAELAPTDEALYRLGLKQFLARAVETNTAAAVPRADARRINTRGSNPIIGPDPSLRASLKATLSRAQSSFELKKMRGR